MEASLDVYEVEMDLARCTICLQDRNRLKFKTGRLSICSYCVSSLNKTMLSPKAAEQAWFVKFRERQIYSNPEDNGWVDGWIEKNREKIISRNINNRESLKDSHELKVMRAYSRGIICLNREYLNYPGNWEFKRYRTKHYDGYACSSCGKGEADGAKLHVHHIIFRSNSGTNSYRNLVTLCFKCHQKQHSHPISENGGEPAGKSADISLEEDDSPMVETDGDELPCDFDVVVYEDILPSFEDALALFQTEKKTAKDFFVFLIMSFGRNVKFYALRFAEEMKLQNRWFRK